MCKYTYNIWNIQTNNKQITNKRESFRLSLQNALFFRHSGHKNGNKCTLNTITLYCQDLNK